MAEHRTDLIVSAKPEGFAELQRQVLDTQERSNQANRAIIEGLERAKRAADQTARPEAKSTDALRADAQRIAADMAKADPAQLSEKFDGLKSKLTSIYQEQEALNELMLDLPDKAGPEYEKLTAELKELESAAKGVARQVQLMDRAHGEQIRTHRRQQAEAQREAADSERMARGSMMQGFLQAALPFPAAFLQRGPGMRSQMLGMMAGGAIGGLAGGAFTGLGGLQQGLAALPMGGVAAGLLGNVAGWGQQALGLERQQVGMMPFMGAGAGYLGRVSAAGRAVRSISDIRAEADASVGAVLAAPEIKREIETTGKIASERMKYLWAMKGGGGGFAPDPEESRKAREEFTTGIAQRKTRDDLVAEAMRGPMGERQRALRRLSEERGRPFAGIIGAGEQYGYGAQEAMQFAQQILMTGGGGGAGLAASGLGAGGFAFQRAYGLQAPTLGAFLMAGRRGGLAGGEGGTGAAVSSIAGAMRMGLEGSELTEYMQTVAAGIESFKNTGIPFARESIEEMGGTLARVGIAGPRGVRMAGAITTAAQGLSAAGIQTPFQLSMLKHLGGFTGGFESAFDAMVKLESGEFAEGGMESLFRERMRMGGGGKRGAAFLSAELQGAGVRLPFGSAALMGRVWEGGTKPEDLEALSDIQKQMTGVAKGAPGSMADVEKRAAGFVGAAGANMREQVKLQNEQLRIGKTMVPILQSLEKSTTKTADQFVRLGSGLMKDYADAVAAVTKGMQGAVGWLQGIGFSDPPGGLGSTP